MDTLLNKSIQFSPLKKEIKIRGSCTKLMRVKVGMTVTNATEPLGTLPLKCLFCLAMLPCSLAAPPAVRAEAGRGPAGQAQSLAASALDKSEMGCNFDMLQKQGCGIFRRWHGPQMSYWYFISAKELNFADCKQK